MATVLNRELQPGKHVVEWAGTNDHEEPVTSGIYFAVVKAGYTALRKSFTVIQR